MARIVLASFVLIVAGCDSVTMWFAPSTTCADWQQMDEDRRSAVVEQVIGSASLFEAVRVVQQAPAGTPKDQLVSMATASVTKSCDLARWNPAVPVKEILRDLYGAQSVGRPST